MKNKILTGITLLLSLSFSMAKESIASQLCLSQPETEIAQCLADEYAKYDLALNNNYKEIMKNLSDEDKKAFKAQQIAWIEEKEKRCVPLASENGKQACLLDATVLKNNQLENKLIDVMPKVFEGDWTSELEDYGVETGLDMVQNGRNICGNWAYFASRGVIGYFQAYQIKKDTAIVTKACSFSPDSGGLASDVKCKTHNANEYMSLSEWKPKQLSYIKICNNKLYNSLLNVYKDPMPSCEQLLADDLKKEKDYKYGADKKQLKTESIKIMTEFFSDCLNEDLSEYQ